MWPSPRRLARSLIYPALTALWEESFALAGGIGAERRRVRPWRTPGRQRIGIVAPHPDDETVGCGGVAALHRVAGDSVAVLIVTDGRRSRTRSLAASALVSRRAAEAQAAAVVLGLAALT